MCPLLASSLLAEQTLLLFRQIQSLIEELKTPPEGSEPLSFPSKYSRGYMTQLRLLMQRTFTEYWRMSVPLPGSKNCVLTVPCKGWTAN